MFFDAEDDNFASGLSDCITRDGQSTITANISFNNKKITSLANASLSQDAVNVFTVQNNVGRYAVSAGTDTITLTLSPAITAYAAGQMFLFKAGGTNTGAATININSLGAKALKKPEGSALDAGFIVTNQFYHILYDGTDFVIVGNIDFGAPAASTFLQRNSGNTAYAAQTAAQVGATLNTALYGGKIQRFTVTLQNVSGTIVHLMTAYGEGTTASSFITAINGALNTATNTPTATDASTAFAAGLKISSGNQSRVIFDTAALTEAVFLPVALVTNNNTGTTLTVQARILSSDVNGTTRARLVCQFYDAATGAAENQPGYLVELVLRSVALFV